jgi:glutamyl-tRNA synthetase
MEGDIQGVCEPAVKNELGNVVQFERVCFARIDAVSKDSVTAYFTHK